MNRIAFKMRLFPGNQTEYKRRHDEIWPELTVLLKEAGICNYSIFLEEDTDTLFAYLQVADTAILDTLGVTEIMQKWWLYMSDISEIEPSGKPVISPLKEVFYLP